MNYFSKIFFPVCQYFSHPFAPLPYHSCMYIFLFLMSTSSESCNIFPRILKSIFAPHNSKWMISESPLCSAQNLAGFQGADYKTLLKSKLKPSFFQNDDSQSGCMWAPTDQSFLAEGSHAGYLQVSVSFIKSSPCHIFGDEHKSHFFFQKVSVYAFYLWYNDSLCTFSLSKVFQFLQ